MQSGVIKTLFIINPILEKKSGKSVAELVTRHLDTEIFKPDIVYSEYPGHAKEIACQKAGDYQVVVAGGGDGTVNQVAACLVNTETALGILPLGSGKGLARALGIPLNVKAGLQTINRQSIVRIDTGMVNQYRFVNMAGIGFDAMVAHSFTGVQRRGFFLYLVRTTGSFLRYSPIPAHIKIENRNISGRFFLVSIANSTQWGYGVHISPHSKTNDGLLDICVFRNFPKILVPLLVTRLFIKTIHKSRYVEIIPVKQVEISGSNSFTGHTDGEPAEFTAPVRISVEPSSLRVIIGSLKQDNKLIAE